MTPTETGERRTDLKAQLLERLHDPLQLRICVIGAVLLIGYGGVYMPLTAQIAETTQKIEREQKMAELADSLEPLQAQCGSFAKRISQPAESKQWTQYVHEGVRRFPLTLTKLDYLPPKQFGPYKAVVLRIELEGSFFDLDQFLRWLDSNPRLFRADDINIALANGKENGNTNKDDMMMQLTVLGMAN